MSAPAKTAVGGVGLARNLHGGPVPAFFRVRGLDDVGLEAVPLHGVDVAVASRGVGQDEGPLEASRRMAGVQDALVAQGHKVIDHETRAALVVVHDGVVLGGAAVPCDYQGGQSRPEFLQPRGGHRRRDDDEPVHLPVGEGFDASLLALGGEASGDEDLLVRTRLQLVCDPFRDLCLEGGRELGEHDADGVRASSHRAGAGLRPVTQFLDRRGDLGLHLGADTGGVANHVRDGGNRDLRLPRYVLDRCTASLGRPGPDGVIGTHRPRPAITGIVHVVLRIRFSSVIFHGRHATAAVTGQDRTLCDGAGYRRLPKPISLWNDTKPDGPIEAARSRS